MSIDLQRDRSVPTTPDSSIQPGTIRIADARLIAWAFAIGERRASTGPPIGRASRRGDLPDVDFGAAAIAPGRSIWSRIAAAFRARSSGVESPEESLPEAALLEEPTPNADNVIPFRRAA